MILTMMENLIIWWRQDTGRGIQARAFPTCWMQESSAKEMILTMMENLIIWWRQDKIDDYLAKQWLLGKRKLTVSVNYGNMPLEYQYFNQYHGFPNPLAGTPLGPRFGLPGPAPL